MGRTRGTEEIRYGVGKQFLTLGELEPSPSAALTVFLTFLNAGIPRDKPGPFEDLAAFRVILEERLADAVFDGSRLSRNSTAGDVDEDVKLVKRLGQFEGLEDDHLGGLPGEVFPCFLVVHGDFTGTRSHEDAGDGCLSLSRRVKSLFACHIKDSLCLY